ncbi:MAG: extracellular solute-binding protein [Bacteroidales bacterium]|nr:extracellular solute-binding protein [Anaerotignum sp.]MCI5678971.1 extracellular solute-binding protein [Bacteroidales bacterium]MDY3927257.1 extracellular solute-binding protein [Anaerotignum sp.]
MDHNKKTGIGGKILLAGTMIFFYLPILYIIVFSFNDSRSLTKLGGFSLRWYEKMFADSTMMEAVVYTIVIALLATIISTIAGTLAAIGLSRSRKVLRNIVEQVNSLPIMNPEIVTAIGLLMFFSAIGIKKGFLTLLLAHIMFCTPYVMLSVSPKLRSLDPNLADAALDLGATPIQALTKVIVPQIMPGIVSGALIAFTMSFDDFIISYFVTGNGVQNISILVYTMSKRINPSINALSTLVILLITVGLILANVVPILKEKKEAMGKSSGKKGIALGLAGIIVLSVLGIIGFGGNSKMDAVAKYGSDTLKLYNWGEYMGENLINEFEKEFGVKVITEYFDSNEMMYTKLQAGDSYDVLVPSDYMIQRMMKDGMLQELDHSLLPNLSELAEGVQNLPYDPDNTYSVPYFWGSVGIVYNHNNVDPAVVEAQGYEILRNTDYKGRIYVYDSERDSFMMALKALGYSMNTENEAEIQEAYEWLLDMNNTMAPIYVTDEVIDGMINGNKDIAVVYSGDATTILEENEDMSFWMPKEGTNLWSDAMVIPANAENPLLAHEFINYVLTYEASMDNSEYVGYTSSNQEVLDELSGEEGLYAENEAYVPRAGYEKDEVFEDNPVLKKTLAELWIKVKAAK